MPYSSYDEVMALRNYVPTPTPAKPLPVSTNQKLFPLPTSTREHEAHVKDQRELALLCGVDINECLHSSGYFMGYVTNQLPNAKHVFHREYGPVCRNCGKLIRDLMDYPPDDYYDL